MLFPSSLSPLIILSGAPSAHPSCPAGQLLTVPSEQAGKEGKQITEAKKAEDKKENKGAAGAL